MGAAAPSGGLLRPTCLEVCSQSADADARKRASQSAGATRTGSKGTPEDGRAAGWRRLLTREATFQDVKNLLMGVEEGNADKELAAARKSAILHQQHLLHHSPDEDLLRHATRGDLTRVQRALEAKANLSKTNARGVSALMLASSSFGKEGIDVVKMLESKKADLHARDINGWTALHHACRNGKTEVCQLLITLQADPTSKTSDKKTCLMLAAIEGQVDLIKELFKFKQVRDQIGDRDALGTTCLHFAVKDAGVEVTRLLLEHGAKVHSKDIDGKMPIMWACEHGKLECAKQLSKRSADVDSKDKSQKTPLLYACINCYEGVALWLIKKGADPNHRDLLGQSPMVIADENGLGEFKRAIKMRRMEAEDDG
eukprot:TRINITY_DN65407_c0_g1_i1.p1 TRINITY_DN65407_c0_g1~~TRINITY_DN65407_c0_g1_i1.p1  ORF type:complete len:397 (+),score=113.11 TRINITY_DN65407_c0_g1_i1:82-1191(+)